jgi:O-antigen/teichoic acid export membrane protein
MMIPQPDRTTDLTSEKGILSRFAYLVSAQGVEGVGSVLFYLYLAWMDATFFGELMYAMAAGSIVFKVVEFGLYYPLVGELVRSEKDKTPGLISRVNVIKAGLLLLALVVILGMDFVKGFSFRMAWTLFCVCLGIGLESLSETFFADLRVQGHQDQESGIKIASAIAAYVYAMLAALSGVNPLLISLFKLVSGGVRLTCGFLYSLRTYPSHGLISTEWKPVVYMFKAATTFALIEILGLLYNRANVFFIEAAVGVKAVAFYSASYNIVEPLSGLASEQLLGWVIFPLLTTLWWKKRENMGPLVRRTAQWLIVLCYPVLMVLYVWSDLIIGLLYRPEYQDAAWMQRYLLWTIILSAETNLFFYVMMVVGASKVLLGFTVIAAALNLLLNVVLVYPLGLLGGCLVLIMTKSVMTVLTFLYCQIRFRFFKAWDFLFPVVLAGVCLGLFLLIKPHMLIQRAVLITFLVYCLILWRLAPTFIGRLPGWSRSSRKA